jgi:hypothetical protein
VDEKPFFMSKHQEMQENFTDTEKFINECDKKYFAFFKKQKNPMDAIEQSILAAELGLSDVQEKMQDKNDKKKGLFFIFPCFKCSLFLGGFLKKNIFFYYRPNNRSNRKTNFGVNIIFNYCIGSFITL